VMNKALVLRILLRLAYFLPVLAAVLLIMQASGMILVAQVKVMNNNSHKSKQNKGFRDGQVFMLWV